MSSDQAYNTDYYKRYYILKKLKAIDYLGGKCLSCGYNQYYGAMEFHHRNKNEKEFSWTKMRCKPWAKIVDELNKCNLLCVRCHREEHQIPEVLERALALLNKQQKRTIQKMKPRATCSCGKPANGKNKFCSLLCSAKSFEKVDWPSNLPELVAASSKSAVAMELGVSDQSVSKRLRNHHAPMV